MYSKEEAREQIKKLAEDFESKIDYIKTSGQYKEAQIEDEFIKPLFKYLNWNISNEGISNTADREFIVQAKGRNGKEPDYLLQLDQKPKFYVEAKHSKYYLGGKVEHATTKEQTDYIWQAYSYSYSTQSLSASKKVDFALLTDFEEFRFFDCTFPVKDNSLLNNYCVIDWTYKDYITKFDELWDYFEKENVRRNSLSGATSRPTLYLNEKKIKANRISPDKAFLNDLDNEESGWRITLAKDIKKYQPEFTSEFITQSVQLILDRFIFIKVLSDREIEEDIIKQIVNEQSNSKDGLYRKDLINQVLTIEATTQLEATPAANEKVISIYERCKDIFHDLDKTYNGSIFSERAELDSVKVSNKTLVGILKDFLPENSRYNFKVIPVEILGTIYEQFLGKVVTTTDKRAKIEYKPEVRKAGGVYYTPDYIVNYIVEKTVGEKLKDCKTIDDLLEIKICDPACGSGSFLIAAYDALIQWTINYYKNKKLTREEQKTVYTDSNGDIRLTSKIKRDILRSCIYGVDIDAQAVEVTKMSLSLKALENTTHYEVHNEVTLFHVCVLPPLEENVKCGNSLVGTDFYNEKDLSLFSMESLRKLNAFDWTKEFPQLSAGNGRDRSKGFDCVIGNPPYVRQEILGEEFKKYAQTKYKSYAGTADLYVYFMEKSLHLLNSDGIYSIIVANKWMRANYGEPLRKFIKEKRIFEIIDFGDLPVFKGATTYPCIIKINNNKAENFKACMIKTLEFESLNEEVKQYSYNVDIKSLDEKGWSLSNNKESALLDKIKKAGIPLGEYVEGKIYRGVLTGLNEAFVIDEETKNRLIKEDPKSKEVIKPFLAGRDVKRYKQPVVDKYLLFTRRGIDIKKYPAILKHLEQYKEQLKPKPKDWPAGKEWKGRKPGPYQWYEVQDSTEYYKEFETEKIIYPNILQKPEFTFDTRNLYTNQKCFIISIPDKYLLGILNSKLNYYLFEKMLPKLQGGFFEPSAIFFTKFPIPNSPNPATKEKLTSLVEQMLEAQKPAAGTLTDNDKKLLQQKSDMIDRQIDKLVYELYGLSAEEISIVSEL